MPWLRSTKLSAELRASVSNSTLPSTAPEARAADLERLAWWSAGDHAAAIDTMDAYRPHRPEGMFGHYLMMVAALGGRECAAIGRRFSEYENAAGTGQVHVWFDRPAEGWRGARRR